MGVLSWMAVGVITGWLARIVLKGASDVLWNVILGIFGALVAGFLSGTLLNIEQAGNNFSPIVLVIAFVGAVLAILAGRAVSTQTSVQGVEDIQDKPL